MSSPCAAPPRGLGSPSAPIPTGSARRVVSRLSAIAVTVLVLLAVGASAASAHVTVNPNTVTAGSYAMLAFRVPTESATASTVSVRVTLPTDHPFPNVSVMQLPGWTAKVAKTELDAPVTVGSFRLTAAVTSITWTADDGVGIKPEEFMEFSISVGPVPDVPSMQFPAEQTYSDGSVVNWDQPRTGGGTEPDHPAPTLTITAAGPEAAGQPAASDDTARILGVVSLVLAALALLVAALGVRRRAAR